MTRVPSSVVAKQQDTDEVERFFKQMKTEDNRTLTKAG